MPAGGTSSPAGARAGSPQKTLPTLSDAARKLASAALDDWSADVIEIHTVSNGHCLLLLGEMIFDRHGIFDHFQLDRPNVRAWFNAIEKGYGNN
eukprot:4693979-Prymnesium_polylepis.1